MSWFAHDGVQIFYEDAGNGEPVLFLPGLAEGIDDHAELREALAVAGYRVIAADLPGSGRSEPRPRIYTASYHQDDARAFLSLLEHLGTGPAHLVGFSDGGEVTLVMAGTLPEMARSVVSWGAAGAIHDPEGTHRDGMRVMIDQPTPDLQGFSDYLIATYGRDGARIMTRSLADALAGIASRGGTIGVAVADRITCPVLLVAGARDPFAPADLLEDLASRIRSVDVEIVPDAEHAVQQSHGAWLNQAVIAWLANAPTMQGTAGGTPPRS